jgi:hypothetical protein
VKSKRGPVEIVGIVHPLGAGGGRAGKETLWTLRFSFQVWRGPDGRIEEQRLSLQRPNLTDRALQEMMAQVKPYDILRLRVRFLPRPSDPKDSLAEVVELLGTESSDEDLNVRAALLKKPVTIAHPVLGTLTLNRAFDSYQTALDWKSHTIRLHLAREGCKDEEALFGLAATLWKGRREWDKQARDFAVKELLELKNGNWLGEDEKEFTPRRFKARMTLEEIAVSPNGHFEFYYNDGNLFWGHVIQVSGTLSQGPTYAGIAG